MQRIDCGGKFTYVFTPYAQPIAEVEDGETFEVVQRMPLSVRLTVKNRTPKQSSLFSTPKRDQFSYEILCQEIR